VSRVARTVEDPGAGRDRATMKQEFESVVGVFHMWRFSPLNSYVFSLWTCVAHGSDELGNVEPSPLKLFCAESRESDRGRDIDCAHRVQGRPRMLSLFVQGQFCCRFRGFLI